MKSDQVNSPAHYTGVVVQAKVLFTRAFIDTLEKMDLPEDEIIGVQSDVEIECCDVMEGLGFQRDSYLWNAFKYLWRCKQKDNEHQDVKKAVWYLKRKIERLEHDA